MAHLPEVDAIAIVQVQLDGLLNGRADGGGFVVDTKRGQLHGVVRTGRVPLADDEIAVGLDTAQRLGVQRGDRIRLTGAGGSRSMRVVAS